MNPTQVLQAAFPKPLAIVVFTTPKYWYILEATFGLLRRYAPDLPYPVYLATEDADQPIPLALAQKYNITLLHLTSQEGGFLESRAAVANRIKETFILPLQEDFLLERPGVNRKALDWILDVMDADKTVHTVRLMPSPPATNPEPFWGDLPKLKPKQDMMVSYQATIWRTKSLATFFEAIITDTAQAFPEERTDPKRWAHVAININPVETHKGAEILKTSLPTDAIHLCWPRSGRQANAVYDSPWPYRPTAIVKGVLQPWATELIQREGLKCTQ